MSTLKTSVPVLTSNDHHRYSLFSTRVFNLYVWSAIILLWPNILHHYRRRIQVFKVCITVRLKLYTSLRLACLYIYKNSLLLTGIVPSQRHPWVPERCVIVVHVSCTSVVDPKHLLSNAGHATPAGVISVYVDYLSLHWLLITYQRHWVRQRQPQERSWTL